MDAGMVAQVRRFNRVVTQRVGALHDRFLARDRPLGEARLLWEIGADGRDVRSLRAQLDLDSGYVSRLLRSLESAGLVSVGPKESDRRVRVARLTAAGSAERAVLDRRSNDLAASILEPLTAGQRARLAVAMAEVERLLTAAMVDVAVVDPAHPHARHCLSAYFAELDRRFDAGFDPGLTIPAADDELRPPAGLLVVATLHADPIGCGALKLHDDEPAELKRMWVDESVRGLGIGRRILADLEMHAVAHGARAVRLETNRSLREAISLYRTAGYTEVAAFNSEAYADHWFEKRLGATPSESVPVDVLFAGIAVADFAVAVDWYGRLLGRPADIVVKEDEVMWRVADAAWLYVTGDADRAGGGLLTLAVPDLDEAVAQVEGRGIADARIEVVAGAGRKASFVDPDANLVTLVEVSGPDR